MLRSLKDRLRGQFNVAVAELDHHDTWQRALVGVVTISPDQHHLQEALRKVENESERLLGRDLVGSEIEVL